METAPITELLVDGEKAVAAYEDLFGIVQSSRPGGYMVNVRSSAARIPSDPYGAASRGFDGEDHDE